MGLTYETSLAAFVLVTLLAGGGAAFAIGRAAAKDWKPFRLAALQTLLLGVAIRFLHLALFAGTKLTHWQPRSDGLSTLYSYAIDITGASAIAALGFCLQRRAQMLRQYGWVVQKSRVLVG